MQRPARRINLNHLLPPLLAALLGVLGCSDADTSEQAPANETGSVGDAADFRPEAHKGKVLVINFWATWCGPCRIEIPDLVKLRQGFPGDDVAIVGIAVSEHGTPEQIDVKLRRFMAEYGINYPIYYDAEMRWMRNYDSSPMVAIPLTVVIDQDGETRAVHRGVPRDRSGRLSPFSALGEEIQMLLDRV
jgi:thiol-disulfide isomerase/thioredoxin